MTSIRPLPLITVADVPASSAWYQQVLGGTSAHGGREYDRIVVDGTLVLQLHAREAGHHHGSLTDVAGALGNGLLLWFESVDFDGTVARVRTVGAELVADTNTNPNSGKREIWVRDLDGYVVVIAEPSD
jgi:hypothetical protein